MNKDIFYKNLEVPVGRVDAILDTDAYNEIDDQFAISYMLLSPEKINTLGICAAPFFNRHSESAADGMEKSYNEILKLLSLMSKDDMADRVYRGSTGYLPNDQTPVISDAAKYIAETSKKYSSENPLYIVAIGAITNVASAILLEPEAMKENTVIVWLGGHALHWRDTKEFNMMQDYAAARVVLDCGAPVVLLPCMGVVSEFRTNKYELEHWLKGKNPLTDYLFENTVAEVEYKPERRYTAWSRVIWDVTAVGWLLNDGNRFMKSYLTSSPIATDAGFYSRDERRHHIRYVYSIDRDALFTDLFKTLNGEK